MTIVITSQGQQIVDTQIIKLTKHEVSMKVSLEQLVEEVRDSEV